jgi:hypothetical protein
MNGIMESWNLVLALRTLLALVALLAGAFAVLLATLL